MGLITSRCSGKEPTLQPRSQGLYPGLCAMGTRLPTLVDRWESSLKPQIIRALFYYYFFECGLKPRYFGS